MAIDMMNEVLISNGWNELEVYDEHEEDDTIHHDHDEDDQVGASADYEDSKEKTCMLSSSSSLQAQQQSQQLLLQPLKPPIPLNEMSASTLRRFDIYTYIHTCKCTHIFLLCK